MLNWWSRTVTRFRWLVVAAAAVVALVGGAWGTGVFTELTSGGFDDLGSESFQASERIADRFGGSVDLVVLYSSRTVQATDPSFRDAVVGTLNDLRGRDDVARIKSYYDGQSPGLLARDGHATYAAITLAAEDESAKQDAFERLRPALDAPGVRTRVGGLVAFQSTTDAMTENDIMRGEMMTMPAVLLLLVLIFGGLVAASMPLIIGVLAILSAFTATRLLTSFTDVSTFAVNTVTLLGLGMAIDYSLLVVSRFREELHGGRDPSSAVRNTLNTAGRTVLVSGVTIALALASLLVFPQVFLRSMGMGGIAAVTMAMVGALTVLPAVLVIVGHRIDALRIPIRWGRRTAGSGGLAGVPRTPAGASRDITSGWAGVAHSVMRRPIHYIVGVLALLAIVGSPFLRAQFSGADERVVPAGTEARVVSETVARDFAAGSVAPIQVYLEGAADSQVRQLVHQISDIPGVTGAEATTAQGGGSSLVLVSYRGPRTGATAQQAVRSIRALPSPAGVDVLVGGRTASDVDRLSSLGDRLPWVALLMAGVTFVLLFLAFGSVLLPVKAIIMNLASITASFGVVVWIFQDGHLSDLLGFTSTGFLEPTIPILVLVILFGLSTDYEVFLLSRIREQWDATRDPQQAIAAGIQRTGGIITAAALLLMVVVGGFATGDVVFAKMIGLSMAVAIFVDATLVRMLLVPATMRLMGRWSWWTPRPLSAMWDRYGLREEAHSHGGA